MHPVAGEGVEGRAGVARVAVAAQAVGAQGVDRDQEDVEAGPAGGLDEQGLAPEGHRFVGRLGFAFGADGELQLEALSGKAVEVDVCRLPAR